MGRGEKGSVAGGWLVGWLAYVIDLPAGTQCVRAPNIPVRALTAAALTLIQCIYTLIMYGQDGMDACYSTSRERRDPGTGTTINYWRLGAPC